MQKSPFTVFILAYAILTTNTLAEPPVIGDERAVPVHLTDIALETQPLEQLLAHGQLLFDAKFTSLDGAGRPAATQAEIPVKRRSGNTPLLFRTAGPEANACNGCHNQPSSGGAGEFVANVFTSEGFSDFEFDSLDAQFSNERGTPHLHGSGLVELLAREITRDLQNIRNAAAATARNSNKAISATLTSKGVNFGKITMLPDGYVDISAIKGVDHDLIVRPFSQKGVFTSLRQFSINAMNAHHGIQSDERWGLQWTDTNDFDEDNKIREITEADMTALVLFQANLSTPLQQLPENQILKNAALDGEHLFTQASCQQCHRQTLTLDSLEFTEPGPYNAAGNLRLSDVEQSSSLPLKKQGLQKNADGQWLIPVFSDLRRHKIADAEKPHYANEQLSQRFIPRDIFLTARLWGVGSTAPYGHRGDVTTLKEAILHHGGEARESRLAFEAMSPDEQACVIEFLKSLRLQQQEAFL